jgi:hypothetical protein
MFVEVRRRSRSDFEAAMSLMEVGRSDTEIAAVTGIPRPTLSAWRHGRSSTLHRRTLSATRAWRPEAPEAYCYLLGAYLGDGCVTVQSECSACLVIVLDSRYPALIGEVEEAICRVLPDVSVRRHARAGENTTVVQARHPALPFAFPQHGPGRKHLRAISLVNWQLSLTHRHPRELLRGLIHSDGCRTVNRFKTRLPSGRVAEYEYPRYFFSNLSADIRGIFCDHCDLLGIRWTQSNPRNISIAQRASVAHMDEFVGPKY